MMNVFRVKGKQGCLVLLAVVLLMASGCAQETIVREQTIIREVPKTVNNSIFFDEFDPGNGAMRNIWRSNGKAYWTWEGATPGFFGCENGCLKQNSEDIRALNAIMYVSAPQISNATIEVKTRIFYDKSSSPTAEELANQRKFIGSGIIFRMVDSNNYYMFRLAGEEGAVLGKMVNNDWIDLANPRRLDFLVGGRIKPSTWYTLKVKVSGSNIQCFINDSPVINMNDTNSPFTVGYFGVSTFKCFADFEYIDVKE